eukprot:1812536-Rhodomonas_salina.2
MCNARYWHGVCVCVCVEVLHTRRRHAMPGADSERGGLPAAITQLRVPRDQPRAGQLPSALLPA